MKVQQNGNRFQIHVGFVFDISLSRGGTQFCKIVPASQVQQIGNQGDCHVSPQTGGAHFTRHPDIDHTRLRLQWKH
jgi:hypothetical protein